jgi:hypothetical protein
VHYRNLFFEIGGTMEATNNGSLVSDSQAAAGEKLTSGRTWVTPEFHHIDLSTALGIGASEDAHDALSNT